MKKIIYVSGKYSGKTRQIIHKNIMVARTASIQIWSKGAIALCPHLNTYHFDSACKVTYDEYLEGDLQLLDSCDAIYMLPNWKNSKGAVIEHNEAKIRKIPILYSMEEVEKFIKKDHLAAGKQCEITGRIRTKMGMAGTSYVDPKIQEKIDEIVFKEVYAAKAEMNRKFVQIPKL